jgi:bis(5'-nucleosidyl)-tetraphosphatase
LARLERSCGAVVFSYAGGAGKRGRRRYLLLFNVKGHWDFPKGRPEPGEKREATILREIREETGIRDLEFLRGFTRQIHWRFRRDGKFVAKKAFFRLARTPSRRIRISAEHARGRWVSVRQGLRLLKFPNARSLLRSADRFLERREKSKVR